MWNYLYFIVHLRTKQKTEFTGPESYVYDQIKDHIESKVRLILILDWGNEAFGILLVSSIVYFFRVHQQI